MRELIARRIDAGELPAVGTSPSEREPNVHRDTIVRDEEGTAVLVVVSLPPEAREAARAALSGYTPGRGSTVLRAGGVRNRATTFGYLGAAAAMRRYGCRACDGARKDPEAHAAIATLAGSLAELTRWAVEQQADDDEAFAGAVDGQWRLAASPWTSGVVNWNSAMPYHYDRNNLPVWSAMVCIREGMRGGYLHVPGFDLTVACHDGDVVWFPGWALMHGVTPLEPQRAEARRLTAVYYALRGLAACLDPPAELTRARARRTKAEDEWKERQRAQGLLGATPSQATEVQVAIPSHARADKISERTLRLLADRGVPAQNVRVFVAPEEVETYRAAVDRGLCEAIEPGALGLNEQHNAITNWYSEGTRLVRADDDVADVRRRVDDKTLIPVDNLVSLFEAGFRACEISGANLWGLYPVLNPMFMKDRVALGLYFIIGQVWGSFNTHEPHGQIGAAPKDDYERTLQFYEQDGLVARLDFAAPKSPMHGAGGLQADDQPARVAANDAAVALLMERYPQWVKLSKKQSPKTGQEIRLADTRGSKKSLSVVEIGFHTVG